MNQQEKEILWNIINSFLSGLLVSLGAFIQAGGSFSTIGLSAGIIAGLIVAVTKFKDYWSTQENEYKCKSNLKMAFNFI